MKKRKRVTMLVTVSVPRELTAAEARREVKTNIKYHSGWLGHLDEDAVKAISVKPAPKSKSMSVGRHPNWGPGRLY